MQLSCDQPHLPEAEKWEFDQTEGITSIVTDVSATCLWHTCILFDLTYINSFLPLVVSGLRASASALYRAGKLHGRSVCRMHCLWMGFGQVSPRKCRHKNSVWMNESKKTYHSLNCAMTWQHFHATLYIKAPYLLIVNDWEANKLWCNRKLCVSINI
jgi:hypothetical protein